MPIEGKLTREEFLEKMARYYDNGCDIFTAAIKEQEGGGVLEIGCKGATVDMLACIVLSIMKHYPETALAILERKETDNLPQNIDGGDKHDA